MLSFGGISWNINSSNVLWRRQLNSASRSSSSTMYIYRLIIKCYTYWFTIVPVPNRSQHLLSGRFSTSCIICMQPSPRQSAGITRSCHCKHLQSAVASVHEKLAPFSWAGTHHCLLLLRRVSRHPTLFSVTYNTYYL